MTTLVNQLRDGKKITKATLKSFIKKAGENVFVNQKSSFDGMTGGVEKRDGGYIQNPKTESNLEHTLGLRGLWVVRDRNLFSFYENEYFVGIEVYNCCGTAIVAIKK